MSLWLKADAGVLDASGNPCTNGVAVATWKDQSGNGNDATKEANPPTFYASVLNGLGVVDFDGSQLLDVGGLASDDSSRFFVINFIDLTYSNNTIGQSGSPQYAFYPNRYIYLQAYPSGVTSSLPLTQNQWLLAELITETANVNRIRIWQNGFIGATSSGSNSSPAAGQIGAYVGSYFLRGQIAEILVYPSALSDPDRIATENYLLNKWINPPSGSLLLKRRRMMLGAT